MYWLHYCLSYLYSPKAKMKPSWTYQSSLEVYDKAIKIDSKFEEVYFLFQTCNIIIIIGVWLDSLYKY